MDYTLIDHRIKHILHKLFYYNKLSISILIKNNIELLLSKAGFYQSCYLTRE